MAYQSPPNQEQLARSDGSCTPRWFNWFLGLVQFVNTFVPGTRTVNGTSPVRINSGASATLAADITVSTNGLTVVITTAKLTGAGVNGSMTFTNGILTAQTQAT